jgi:hypothetical protein
MNGNNSTYRGECSDGEGCDIVQGAFDREPLESDWGFCAYGDAPAAIGGGISAFYWFESREEMLTFIAEHALLMNLPRSDLDLNAVWKAVGNIVEAMRNSRISDAAAVNKLNEKLRHASQFTWLGTFGSLRQGETKEARDVIDEFRDAKDNTPASPVSERELEDFREFLREYSIH